MSDYSEYTDCPICPQLATDRDDALHELAALKRSDTIERLLELIEAHCDDFTLGNDGGDPNIPKWYGLGYWYEPPGNPDGGRWEIDVAAPTLRELLCTVIAHPRFGQ